MSEPCERGDGWMGPERRSIPIHILELMDKRLAAYEGAMRGLVGDHTKDEMERYKAIQESINTNREASEERHRELTAAITRHTEATEKALEAILAGFPKNERGEPDLSGHADDHKFRLEEAKEAREFRAYVKKVVAASVLLAALVWGGPVILKALVAMAAT